MIALNIVVAHALEAKAIISGFNASALSSTHQSLHRFDWQEDIEVSVLVSGERAQRAFAGVHYLAGVNAGERSQATRTLWLNFGVAGHGSLELGDIVMATKVNGPMLERALFPTLIAPWRDSFSACQSVNAPSMSYSDALLDMEASGFVAAAQDYATTDQFCVVKVVSDNPANPHDSLDKATIKRVLQGSEAPLFEFLERWIERHRVLIDQPPIECPEWPFATTVSQQRQIDALIHTLVVAHQWTPEQLKHLSEQSNAKQAIEMLHRHVSALTLELGG